MCPKANKVRVKKKKITLTHSLFKENDWKTVLRKHFLNTLGIKQDFVYGAITKANDTGIVSQMREASTKTTKVHLKTTLMRSRITSKVFLWFPPTTAAMTHLNCSWRLLKPQFYVPILRRIAKAEDKGWVTQSKYREIFNRLQSWIFCS